MKFRYESVTGEIMEIDVEMPVDMEEAIIDIDEDNKRNERREKRRWHKSLDAMQENGIEKADDTTADVFSIIEQQEMKKALNGALSMLLPQQRELIRKVYFKGRTITDIAREEGVSKVAIYYRLDKIHERLKKIMSNG